MKIIFQRDDGEKINEITIDTENEDALLTNMLDISQWVTNAISEKVRRVTDKIIEKSGRGSRESDPHTKKQIIMALKNEGHALMKTLAVKDAELAAAEEELRNARKKEGD